MKHPIFNRMKQSMKAEPALVDRTRSQLQGGRVRGRLRPLIPVAAAICLVAVAALLILRLQPSMPIQGEASGESPVQTSVLPSESAAPAASSRADLGKHVAYEDLSFPHSQTVTAPENFVDFGDSACIKAFEESDLRDLAWAAVGTVTDIEFRQYEFDVYDNKFEENGTMHWSNQSIVYTFRVENLLYARDAVQQGDLVKLEVPVTFAFERTAPLQIGRRYVLPVHRGLETVQGLQPEMVASGSVQKASPYEFVYIFLPPIEVTQDERYVFHEKWPSLINDQTADVAKDDPALLIGLKLRSDDAFLSDFQSIIERYNPQ